MAKDTEKLIRQLSLISYLMAERRTVTATEIRRDVEGYSDMTEDAFARRFYADRAELADLGIHLAIDRGPEGSSEQEAYSLAPEAFHLPAIAFTDDEMAALQTMLSQLDGKFAYAEPLRLALQQVAWGRPNPLAAPSQQTVHLALSASAGGGELSQRLAKLDTAIYRRKTVEFEYHTMSRDETAIRRVDPYQLVYAGRQFYLVGRAHDRDDIRVFRLSRILGKVAYATKAEHDFQRPEGHDYRAYADRVPWQYGELRGEVAVWVAPRIAWQVERHFGMAGTMERGSNGDGGAVFKTPYANERLLVSWVLGFDGYARIESPPELAAAAEERLTTLVERHRGEPQAIPPSAFQRAAAAHPAAGEDAPQPPRRSRTRRSAESAIRPERFARLVTLASLLIEAGRLGRRPVVRELCRNLHVTESELREDINVLNVVNFGGGAYVLYAEVVGAEVEVDPEPYSDTFDRPARLLPVEARALVAAIDYIGAHDPRLERARERIVDALGHDPVTEGLQMARTGADDEVAARAVNLALVQRRLLRFTYYKPNEDEVGERTVEPYALMNGREGWYIAAYDLQREGVRHFRLDRVRQVAVLEERFDPRPDVHVEADLEGWPKTGVLEGSRTALVWIAPDQARWTREERATVAELEDGSIVVEFPFGNTEFLVKEILKEAGDAVVLEPRDAREAVLAAGERLLHLPSAVQ